MPDSPVPQHCPSPRELDDLELLTHGALRPLTGFEGEAGLVTLQVAPAVAEDASAAGSLELVDPEGLPLARVTVEATYDAGDRVGIQGTVTVLAHHEFGAFRRHFLSPEQARQRAAPDAVTVPVDDALTTSDLAAIRDAAGPRQVQLLALVGSGTPRGLSREGLVRATVAAAEELAQATVVAVPLAARADSASSLALRHRVVAAFAPGEVVEVHAGGRDFPEAVGDVVRFDRPEPSRQGLVVFFTGLSGSGKSTIARALHDRILETGRRTVTSLDGDVVRRNLSAGLTFSKEDRETNIRRIGWVAAEISRHGGVAICSPIAPFDDTRQQVRRMVEDATGAFVLVHVATPLEECERRDRKGLYAKARRGEIPEFTGISSPYEEPADAAIRVDTTGRTIEDALEDVLGGLEPYSLVKPVETNPLGVAQ